MCCATRSVATWWKRSAMRLACWWSTKPVFSKRRIFGRRGTAIFRHGGSDRKLSGRGVPVYASRWGHALIDRRLYLPRAWAEDEARRAKTSVPEDVTFKTKPEIAIDLIVAALDAGVPCAFVLGDALYSSDRRLRHILQARQQPYVSMFWRSAAMKP
jgi:hypothetical protein